MGFWVYIIESKNAGRRYVGQTNDLQRRLEEHNNPDHKPAKYTSKVDGPWRLVYSEEFDSRSQAIKKERWLKSTTGRRWLDKNFGRASPPGKTLAD